MKAISGAVAVLVASFVAGGAFAQDFPSKLVRIVIPFPPGGSAEAQARIVGQALSDDWKQPVIIENKPGGGTTIGSTFVAKSAPDGYTLYLASTSHTIAQSLYKNLQYHAVKSFAPISLIAVSPLILTVHPGVKAQTVRELIDLARATPNGLTYGSSGSGASPHLSSEIFRAAVNLPATHVPFKGAGPALTALLGAQVDFFFADAAVLPQLQAGKLRALGVSTAQRSALIPNVPTIAESGVPQLADYATTNWSSLLAPAGTPRDVVLRINASVRKALALPEVKQRFNAQGFEPNASTPEELEAQMTAEVAKYAKAVADSGAKVD